MVAALTHRATRARASLSRDVEWPPSFCRHPEHSDFHVNRIFSATVNSLRGLIDGVRTEPALRDEAILLAVALPLGVVVAPSGVWYAVMIGVILVLFAVEFLNTAIEKLADHVTREQHNDIRRIKDFGSAAVFCGLCLTGLVWLAAIAVRFGLL
jgi:diacylglycerol kinase (ATP)